MFEQMDKVVKEFLQHLDTMLENDKDINVNSVDDLINKANEHLKNEL